MSKDRVFLAAAGIAFLLCGAQAAHGAITLRGCATGTSSYTWTANVSLASGTSNGDMVVVAIYDTSGDTVTPAAGYTLQYDNTGATDFLVHLLTHSFSTGDSTTPTFSVADSTVLVWVTCSYENVGGVEGVTGTNNGSTESLSIPSATGSGLTTSHTGDRLVAIYGGYIDNYTGSFTTSISSYPGGLVQEDTFNSGGWNFIWFADETIDFSGASTGTLTATVTTTAASPPYGAGDQLLLYPSTSVSQPIISIIGGGL